jgi:hypothetical protein
MAVSVIEAILSDRKPLVGERCPAAGNILEGESSQEKYDAGKGYFVATGMAAGHR